MEHVLLFVSLFIVALMLLSLYRAIVGPTTLDRLMGMNAIGTKAMVLIVFIGYMFGRVDMFVDIALAYAVLNFIAVLAASRYLHKKGLKRRPLSKEEGA